MLLSKSEVFHIDHQICMIIYVMIVSFYCVQTTFKTGKLC